MHARTYTAETAILGLLALLDLLDGGVHSLDRVWVREGHGLYGSEGVSDWTRCGSRQFLGRELQLWIRYASQGLEGMGKGVITDVKV
jgi:hypothetical protein